MYGADALGAEGTLDNNFRLRKRRACATYGNRAAKWTATELNETLYFNTMWTWHTDTGLPEGQYSKHIYLGETRVVTKQTSKLEASYGQSDEWHHQYYYHPDHLGSAQLVTDFEGNEYQRIEYTPYGELWVEKKSEHEKDMRYLPYKFTAKEMDEETGLYYYGARYLDAKYSRWMSADPAVSDYIPMAPVSDEAKKHNQSLPGMGGIFNIVNFQLYHYAGNNPVKYTDPDGREDGDSIELSQRDIDKINTLHPEIRDSVTKMLQNLKKDGITVEITLAYRSYEEQDALYSQGRNEKGEVTDASKVVTNAKGGQSYHNFGLAFDLTVYDKDGKKDWNKDSDSWKKVIAEEKEQGFEAGAEWTDFPDLPHFQNTFGFMPRALREKKEKNETTDGFVNVK